MPTNAQLSRHMQTTHKIHAQLSKPANKRGTCRRHTLSTCRHTHSSRDKELNQDTRSALETCQQALSSRGTCRHTLSAQHRKLNEDTRSALKTCQLTLSSRDDTRSAHQDTRSALKTCQQTRHMQTTYAQHMQAHTHSS
jgi:hypothetical protein